MPSSKYEPPKSTQDLIVTWLRRARDAQLSHYAVADLLARRNLWMGVPVIVLTAAVGASAFASVLSELVPVWAKIIAGAASVLAAVLASLQTFFKYSERAERHKTFAAKYGAVRRELESLHASDRGSIDANTIDALRDTLDNLAEDAPAVPAEIFERIQSAERNSDQAKAT